MKPARTQVERVEADVAPAPFAGLGLHGAKLLVVASSGGHLTQAMRICELLEASPDSLFVTFRSPQSEQLAAERRMDFSPYVAPRAVGRIVTATPGMWRRLSAERFDAVITTGAGFGVSAMTAASLLRVRCIFVESVSRVDGPSLTGRIARLLPGVETYAQYLTWASPSWHYAGDILPVTVPQPPHLVEAGPLKCFVTLGTIQPYRFDALVDAVLRTLPPGTDVTWQLGETTRTDLPGRAVTMLSAKEFATLAAESDLVISHAGAGTALELAELGTRTILVPRRVARGEHVDDHQVQLCRAFSERGLISYREVEDLSTADLLST